MTTPPTPPGFFDERAAANYLDGPSRSVPGYDGLLRMAGQLLAETVPQDASILVHGAGGGLELTAFARAHPGWTFDGVDPSAPMLALAARTTSDHAPRIRLHQGYIEAAPSGPFHGATSLLTFHFVPPDQRLQTLVEIRQRLHPGAPFVLAHISFPQSEPERTTWLTRHVAYGAPAGTPSAQLAISAQALGEKLSILSPEQDQAMLAEAGFVGITPFYAALSFRGWLAFSS